MNVKVFGLPTPILAIAPVSVPLVFVKSLELTKLNPAGKISNTSTLVAVLGPDEFAERMRRREATLAATCGGLLKREVFSASADRGESAPSARAEPGALHAGPEGGFL